jgi:hypothetical protein
VEAKGEAALVKAEEGEAAAAGAMEVVAWCNKAFK